MESSTVDVDIHGHTYTLRGGSNPAAVKRIAAYVDEQMREISQQTHTADTTRVAILAALNITGELFESDGSDDGGATSVSADAAARDDEMIRLLDEVLLA